MNKTELIESIATKADISKSDAKKALEAFIESVAQGLKEGKKISLIGFGTFAVSERAARDGRNPRTGETIKIPAKKVVKFSEGSELSASIN